MAEPLINRYGAEIPRQIAAQLSGVDSQFDCEGFIEAALEGYDQLALMDRGRHLAKVLHRFLPSDQEQAIQWLVASMGPRLERDQGNSMAPFLYLPHSFYLAHYGLDHFEASMQAQYQLTQRFTAEFSIRPFLERYPEATLERLHQWAEDNDHHVRRLVSEGTRPRLPWAPRLKSFQKDPQPVLALLEKLKDDPELYVRRSVANNLNDIGKDHPDVLLDCVARWSARASEARRWIIRHALRSLVKQGHPQALALLGYGEAPSIKVEAARLTPEQVQMGDKVPPPCVNLSLVLHNPTPQAQELLVDFCVHYVKANGSTAPKVFKLKTLTLDAGASLPLSKRISLAEMTTRRHYPGTHRVELLINGQTYPLGAFELL
ncbi:DNA alkylation repair protein [Marinospirillum alkaliphilum]|uniref:3-methyladenine DNA glycosylase AlkC n=1 Tax=Marinospirillum alkaliphilum DSM 21637 TaxID=1122209 RepID=A0A1K1XN11_9GAMM|nr:DNA alkylation repair protein [Marinospirillum alkaliphilum]SFX50755.1 3-methyladenine DNA glycosylase AlkC [Marinospirillum alkaliphilum DSM 21637]